LVGESGSGKSVLGLSLLGLLPEGAEVQGRASVDGIDMVSASEREKRAARHDALGAVFQDPMSSLNPTMRVNHQVREAAGSNEEALRLLQACGIPDAERRMRQYPHELSGGLRQRVMLAMALAGNPKLVIADEPTTALDVTVQAQVLRLFRHVRDQFGCAMILITHDLAVAASIADRICVLYAGRVVELGRARDALSSPAHPYTAALLDARIALDADRSLQLPMLGGEPPDARVDPVGCAFSPRCPRAEEICAQQRPALTETPGHAGLSACHFSSDPEIRFPLPRLAWPAATSATGGVAVENLRVAFSVSRPFGRRSSIEVLHGVELRVAPGECVSLVGESGSGKTTLLRVLAGLQQPTSGTLELPGKRAQMVFQDAGASLTPWLSVGEILEDRIRNISREHRRLRVLNVLGRLGLPAEVVSLTARQLSGGQRQRVALARAVIEPPQLLLCDEPISALDASLAATVLNLIGELRRELGFSMVFVTHDLAAARLVADRIVVMTEGRLIEDGPAEQLIASPQHEYTRALLGAVPVPRSST
jgi:peptide/nickel transport system ATP-binding protein